jgi:hypothetical protein
VSFWNYRVIHSQREYPASMGKLKDEMMDEFSIREVYYNDDNTIHAISQEGMAAYGESIEELKEAAVTMLEAFKAPILKEWEIEFVDYSGEFTCDCGKPQCGECAVVDMSKL